MGEPLLIPRIVRARYVAPMSRPVIENGAVAIERGWRIGAVGAWPEVRRTATLAPVEDLGDCMLVPGLINAHAHLDLTEVARPAEMPGFVPWLLTVMSASIDPRRATTRGIVDCRRFGVTCVGDITRHLEPVSGTFWRMGQPAVCFGELTAMAGRRHLLEPRLAEITKGGSNDYLHLGVSPHAPYSIEPQGYARCVAVAKSRGFAITTHLAESPDEGQFLEHQTGPFRELWEKIGGWDDAVPKFIGGPIRYAQSLGLVDHPTLLAHVNYCDDAELAILAAGKASVAYCPRTHAYFQHPPHRWREMLAAGINVAVGTDSVASGGDLNLLDDLRLLQRLAPDFPVEQLWEMATVRAAKALLREREFGSLEPGKRVAMIAFDAPEPDPLRAILESDALPRQVWIGGRQLAGRASDGGPR
jgi:aminodeoxyfutalosine deaminase